MKKLIVMALAASTAGMFAVPAQAESVLFVGNRAVECSVTGYSGTINFGALGRNGEASPVTDNGIDVFCNQPFTASLTSQNGYLKLQTTNTNNDSVSETNFTSSHNSMFNAGLDYGVVIPGVTTPQGSQHLTAGTPVGGGLGTIPALYANGLTATYDTVNSSKPLLGGTYSDTVTLTLTPQGV
jgi:spore coat protein U-like protein